MNLIKSIRNLSRGERTLWLTSLFVIAASFLIMGSTDYLILFTSLLGATSLIFQSKGDAMGQLLIIIFAVLYGIISFQYRYYGEMITYLGMTAPSAFVAMVNWLRNPYTELEVKVHTLTKTGWAALYGSSLPVTVLFYFILGHFGTANLFFSTISVTTSFLASMLTVFRSQYYALIYAMNDIILIVLWTLATADDWSYLPMVICFAVFLVTDSYAFFNWRRIKSRQLKGL